MNTIPRLLVALTLLIAGCTLQAGVERAQADDPGAVATSEAQATRLAALEQTVAAQSERLAALAAAAASPEPTPAAVLTPSSGQLAYVLGGDLWVRTLPDGEARRLTADGRNREPHWSPSGGWLSFRKDGGLWLMRADGTGGRSLGAASDAAWSPVDDRLAYINWDRSGFFILDPEALANTDASGEGRLVFVSELPADQSQTIHGFAWLPEGTDVAFGVSTWEGEQPTAAAVWQVGTTPEDAEPWVRFDPGEASAALLPAAWGSGGEGLLILRDAEHDENFADDLPLLLAPDDTTLELPTPLQRGEAFLGRAPDGAALALALGAGTSTWEGKKLTLLDLSDGELWELTGEDTVALTPRFAPDGLRLAYVAMPASSDLLERRIWLRDLGDDVPRQLTGDPLYRDESPFWSADGEQLFFLRMTRDGRVSLWVIATDGGAPRRLVDELTPAPDWFANEGAPDWAELFSWHPGA